MHSPDEYPIKIAVVGDKNVGKTTIIGNLCEQSDDSSDPIWMLKHTMNVLGNKVSFHLFEAKKIRDANADTIILVCDLTAINFDQTIELIAEIGGHGKIGSLVLIANKSDHQNKFIIQPKEFEDLAALLKLPFAFVSAKTGDGIHELFEKIAQFHLDPHLKETMIKSKRLCIVNGINGQKRNSLIKAKDKVDNQDWNKKVGMLFWKRAPKYVTLTRALLYGYELNSLSARQVDDLYEKYLIICKDASSNIKGVDLDTHVLFRNLYLSTFTADERLHHAASILFKQTSLPYELIEPIVKMAGQGLNVSAKVASDITEEESNYEKSLMSLYFLCIDLKQIHQEMSKGKETIAILELGEIENNLTLERSDKKLARTVLKLNEHKENILKKYGGDLRWQLYNYHVIGRLEQLHDSSLADQDFDNLLNLFKSSCQDVINPHKKLRHAANILFQFTPLDAEQIDPIIKMVAKSLSVSANEASEITKSEKACHAHI